MTTGVGHQARHVGRMLPIHSCDPRAPFSPGANRGGQERDLSREMRCPKCDMTVVLAEMPAHLALFCREDRAEEEAMGRRKAENVGDVARQQTNESDDRLRADGEAALTTRVAHYYSIEREQE